MDNDINLHMHYNLDQHSILENIFGEKSFVKETKMQLIEYLKNLP